MFKTGQLCVNPKTGTYVEVIAWPLVKIVRVRKFHRHMVGSEIHVGSNFTLIGNNYKAKG